MFAPTNEEVVMETQQYVYSVEILQITFLLS